MDSLPSSLSFPFPLSFSSSIVIFSINFIQISIFCLTIAFFGSFTWPLTVNVDVLSFCSSISIWSDPFHSHDYTPFMHGLKIELNVFPFIFAVISVSARILVGNLANWNLIMSAYCSISGVPCMVSRGLSHSLWFYLRLFTFLILVPSFSFRSVHIDFVVFIVILQDFTEL